MVKNMGEGQRDQVFSELSRKLINCLEEMGYQDINGDQTEFEGKYGQMVIFDYGRVDEIPTERSIIITGKYFNWDANRVEDVRITLHEDYGPYQEKNEEFRKKLLTQPLPGSQRLRTVIGRFCECPKCGSVDFIVKDGKHTCGKCGYDLR